MVGRDCNCDQSIGAIVVLAVTFWRHLSFASRFSLFSHAKLPCRQRNLCRHISVAKRLFAAEWISPISAKGSSVRAYFFRTERQQLPKVMCFAFASLICLSCLAWGGKFYTSGLQTADVPVKPFVHADKNPVHAFPEAFPMQVAVYLTAPDQEILGLLHALREMGIPFFVTTDLNRALQHPLLIIYPTAAGTTFTPAQIQSLTRYVSSGKSVFAVNIFAGGLRDLFGFTDYTPSRRRYFVNFAADADPALRYINRPEELQTRLGDPHAGDIYWTNGYASDGSSQVIARFDDGSAAVLRRKVGSGFAYLAGLSLEDAVLRSQLGRHYQAPRHYVNAFEPGADVWLLFLRAWYESREPDAVRLSTIPDGQSSVLLLSHDVDWENSFAPMLDYARMESQHHARSSFMIQTNYVTDYSSRSFFYGENLEYLKQVYALGSSIGSHSVIHSMGFNHFSLGTGDETFATYRPANTGRETATGADVFGEVRVSKELIDGLLTGHQTILFRSPGLRIPEALPEALQRCGYFFDSSFTADDVLSNFPYPLPLGLGFEEESGIDEFPIAIEDTEPPPALPLPQRVPQALEVIRGNAENEAINVVLIHSNEAGAKLHAEEQILEQLPPTVTATDLLSYAEFWRARNLLRWSFTPEKNSVALSVQADAPVAGITFEFQRAIAAVSSDSGAAATVLPDHRRIVLPPLSAGQSLQLHVTYAQ
jgi:hypothetical protein